MSEARQMINQLLVKLFNDILAIEQAALQNNEFGQLTMTEFHVIEAIGLGAGRSMTETASMTGVTIGTLTSTVNRLIAKGAVERRRDETDRRVVQLTLTTRGRRAYQHHERFHEEMTESILTAIRPEDDEVLVRTLAALEDFFGKKAAQYRRRR